MSINAMTNAAAARRPDTFPLGEFPKNMEQIARASATPPRTTAAESGKAATTSPSPVDTTYNVLFGYIPTEVITLYVAVLAAVQQQGKVTTTDWSVFWIFLIATPVIVWLVYGAKLKAIQKPLPIKFGAWPVWEMVAATAAFSAWAFALPNSPFTRFDWYSSGLSGLAVVIVSTFLGLLAPFFQRALET